MTHQESYTVDEINGFMVWLKDLSNGMKGMDSLNFYRDSLLKSADVIEYLFVVAQGVKPSELSTGNRGSEDKITENEKRDIPPTPPIESKAKDSLSLTHAGAGAGACEGASARTYAEADAVFEEFWREYPSGRKVAKKKCHRKVRRLYAEAKDKAKFINAFLGGLKMWKSSADWGDGYVCNPETWINQERWLCVPEQSLASFEEDKQERKAAANARAAEELRRLGL